MDQSLLLDWLQRFNGDYVGPAICVVMIVLGIFFVFRLGFVQRYIPYAVRLLIRRGGKGQASESAGMTSLQALTTAAASQVGTGNIVGISIAMTLGGPGALFWLWVSAFLGIGTIFAEAVLGQRYRTQEDGHAIGGPAFYIASGVGSRWMARLFALFFIFALGGVAVMIQANAIADSVTLVLPFQLDKLYIGLVLVALVSLVLLGGLRRIAHFSETVVPFMAGAFILVGFGFLAWHFRELPGVFADIFRYAFTTRAGIGGAAGIGMVAAIRYGVTRGLLINEAGLGTTPHAHAIAQVDHPYEQGLIAIVSVALNTVICSITALVVLTSRVLETHPEAEGVVVAQKAFATLWGDGGPIFIALVMFFFSFTTVVALYFFAAQNVRFLWGHKAVGWFRYFVLAVLLLGSVTQATLAWELMDLAILCLVMCNAYALLRLSPEVVEEVRSLRRRYLEDKTKS